MRNSPVPAVLAFSLACLLPCLGCKTKSTPAQPPRATTASAPAPAPAPTPAAVPASAPNPRGDLQTIAKCWRDLAELCARSPLPFRSIEARARVMAESAGQLIALRERSRERSAKPGEAPAAAAAEPEAIFDLDLIDINSCRLASAAALWDGPNVSENWAKLDLACKRFCPAAEPADKK